MDMKLCALLVQLAILCMVTPQTSGWWFIKDVLSCGFFWDFVCPTAVAAGGAAAAVGTGGAASAGIAVGVATGTAGCQAVRRSRCKRELEARPDLAGGVEYAFPDEFEGYDINRDGLIEYEEFIFTLMNLIPMKQPEMLRMPFDECDTDKNGRIDREEWAKAPLLLKHPTDKGVESLRVDTLDTKIPEKTPEPEKRRMGYGYYGYGYKR